MANEQFLYSRDKKLLRAKAQLVADEIPWFKKITDNVNDFLDGHSRYFIGGRVYSFARYKHAKWIQLFNKTLDYIWYEEKPNSNFDRRALEYINKL